MNNKQGGGDIFSSDFSGRILLASIVSRVLIMGDPAYNLIPKCGASACL